MLKSTKFTRSIQLLKVSLEVTRKNKKLLFFPLANAVFIGCIVGALFFYVFTKSQIASHVGTGTAPFPIDRTAFMACLAILYIMGMFYVTFLNVALYHEIIKAMAGEQPSIRQGLAFSLQRIRTILAWTLFASSIGILIALLSERFGLLGRFVLRMIGLAWSVASTFAIPIIVRQESTNPVVLLKNSAVTIKKTWGEFIIGYVGMEVPAVALFFGLFLLAIVAFVVFSLLLNLAYKGLHAAHIVSPAVGKVVSTVLLCSFSIAPVLLLIALLLAINMANNVFRCALYVYASEGVVPAPYTADMMDAAWKVKTTS